MAMKGHSTFSKDPSLLEPNYQIVLCHNQDIRWWGSYPAAEMKSVYSTAAANFALHFFIYLLFFGLQI